jgi:hypothetical protein
MAEKEMIAAVQAALDHTGIDDTIAEVGQFQPRGMTGSMFAGGMIGSEIGDVFGGIGDAVGTGAGVLGGVEANSASRGMPTQMLVGASPTMVYGFKMRSRAKEPHDLVFQVPRDGLQVKVHGRVNVRVLELVQTETGTKVELEGNRLPITHSHDLIKYLAGDQAAARSDSDAAAKGEELRDE